MHHDISPDVVNTVFFKPGQVIVVILIEQIVASDTENYSTGSRLPIAVETGIQ